MLLHLTRRRRTILTGLLACLVASTAVACGGSLQPSSSPTFRASASPIDSASPIAVSPPQTFLPLPIPAASPTESSCDKGPSQPPKPGVPNGWPVMLGDVNELPRIGPDGTSYLVQDLSLVALDATGREPAGWPVKLRIAPIDSTGYAPTDVEVGPDGTVYVTGGDTIEAFHPNGTRVAGWPYRASRILYPAAVATLLPVAQGLYTNINPGQAVLLGMDGVPRPGWPVSLPSAADGSPSASLLIGPDGTLYGEDQTADTIYAYGSDGALKPGWPLQGWAAMTFDPSGRIYVWKHRFAPSNGARYSGPAIETQIGALDATGRFYPGWPMKFDGPASQPTFGPDGTVYVTRGTSYGPGNPKGSGTSATILAFDRTGNPRPGWPVSLPAGYWALGSYPAVSQVASDPPVITPDGSVYVIAAAADPSGAPPSHAIFAFLPGGRPAPGWPRAIGVGQLSNVMADAAGSGWLMAGSAGMLYLTSDNRILKLQSDGALAPGWPLSRPCGASPQSVGQTSDGGLLVLWNAGAKPFDGTLEIRYRPDGSVAGT
jgi:hypothetical protein